MLFDQSKQSPQILSVTVVWPHKDLSPNARVHYRTRNQLIQNAKNEAYLCTKGAINAHERQHGHFNVEHGDYFVFRYFRPPDRRRRDEDNVVASMKGAQDGIFAAMGVDDSKIRLTITAFGPPEKPGWVEYEIMPLDKELFMDVMRKVVGHD